MKSLSIFKSNIDEGLIATSDFKIGIDGRKQKAHRVTLGDTAANTATPNTADYQNNPIYALTDMGIKESQQLHDDPPFALILKRKSIRLYPNGVKIALYYNEKLNKYFSVPYSTDGISSTVQAENYNIIHELNKIQESVETGVLVYPNGEYTEIEPNTAKDILSVYNNLNEETKVKFSNMANNSLEDFNKVLKFVSNL